MIVLHRMIKLSRHKNLNNQWMSVMSCKIGEYMDRRKILMNQRTSLYFKYIYIEFTTMCDVIMNKKNKIFKENRLPTLFFFFVVIMSIQTHLPTLRTRHRNFMSIQIMWNFNTRRYQVHLMKNF